MKTLWKYSPLTFCLLTVVLLINGCSGSPTGNRVAEFSVDGEGVIWQTKVSSNGEYLVLGKDNKGIATYKLSTGELLWAKQDANEDGFAVDISPDGTMIASGTNDGKVLIRDTKTGEIVKTIMAGDSETRITQVLFSPNSKLVAIDMTNYDYTMIWDIQTNEKAKDVTGFGHLFWSLDSQSVGFACFNQVALWNVATNGAVRLVDQAHFSSDKLSTFYDYGCTPIATSEKSVLTAEYSYKQLSIWDVLSENLLFDIEAESDITICEWSSDGNFLAIGLDDGTIMLWNREDNKITRSFHEHDERVNIIRWTLSDSILVSMYKDKTIQELAISK
jgi:WD40 repeat protein